MDKEQMIAAMAKAMQEKRNELINQPLHRIWEQLAEAAFYAAEQAKYNYEADEGYLG